MSTKEKIAVMQALEDGSIIEHQRITSQDPNPWETVDEPVWNWAYYTYRIKPSEPEYVWISFDADSTPKSCITTHVGTAGMIRYRRDDSDIS